MTLVLLFFSVAFIEDAPVSSEPTLEDLCARYETLSVQMTQDFLATQPSLEKDAAGPDVAAEIEAQSRYKKTRQELKDVVQQLGTRDCPATAEEDADFPPLL